VEKAQKSRFLEVNCRVEGKKVNISRNKEEISHNYSSAVLLVTKEFTGLQ
jgi:hypothetical protein